MTNIFFLDVFKMFIILTCGDPRCTQSKIGSCFSQPRTCGLEKRWLVEEDGTGDTCVFVSELIKLHFR